MQFTYTTPHTIIPGNKILNFQILAIKFVYYLLSETCWFGDAIEMALYTYNGIRNKPEALSVYSETTE